MSLAAKVHRFLDSPLAPKTAKCSEFAASWQKLARHDPTHFVDKILGTQATAGESDWDFLDTLGVVNMPSFICSLWLQTPPIRLAQRLGVPAAGDAVAHALTLPFAVTTECMSLLGAAPKAMFRLGEAALAGTYVALRRAGWPLSRP